MAVEANRQAFGWGRLAAHDPARVWKTARPLMVAKAEGEGEDGEEGAPETLDAIVEHRAAFLGEYQDERWAERYRRAVERVRAAEAERTPGRGGLAEAVARNLFRLMSYKDEYEVARLYTSGEFEAGLRRQFEGDFRLRFHLAPPLLARRDPETGELRKREYGGWMLGAFRVLARMRRLRGTRLDLFGRTAERRMERRLIEEYRETVGEILDRLAPANHEAGGRARLGAGGDQGLRARQGAKRRGREAAGGAAHGGVPGGRGRPGPRVRRGARGGGRRRRLNGRRRRWAGRSRWSGPGRSAPTPAGTSCARGRTSPSSIRGPSTSST